MEILLEKIGIINFKYEKLNARERFNVFTILLNKSDEVNLHSRFIGELLDRKGVHGQEDIFTKHFLEIIGIDNFHIENYIVRREYRNIDLLISNGKQAIIIENKIWADDQDKQLERYYELIRSEGYEEIMIYYLTIWGSEPSENSIGFLKNKIDVGLISYDQHIQEWLNKSIEASSRFPIVRETLIQYQNVIDELTGKTMGQEQKDEIFQLLTENDNIIKAHSIATNWSHVKKKTELLFWEELESQVLREFKILDYQKYSSANIDSVIYQSRNKNPYYGLMFEIGSFRGESICLFIERGWQNLYYGLTVQRNGDRKITDEDIFDELVNRIDNYCEWKREHLWLGGKWFSPEINFESFSDETTLRLSNSEIRKKCIVEQWVSIMKFIRQCQSVI